MTTESKLIIIFYRSHIWKEKFHAPLECTITALKVVFIFCCPVTNGHPFGCRKQCLFIKFLYRSEVWVAWITSLLVSNRAKIKGSSLEVLGKDQLLNSLRLLATFSSSRLEDWGLHFQVGCWLGFSLIS